MARVPVFVPWHVAARDAVVQRIPTTPVARAVAATLVAVVGSVVSGLTLWIASRGDMLAVFTGLVGEEARQAVTNAAGDLVVALFGPQVIGAVQQIGPAGIAWAGAGFVFAALATILGLRRIAASSRARS